LATAKQKLERAGMHGRVRLAAGDATQFSGADLFQRQTFDRIFASYVLSMIPDWTTVIEKAVEHLAPDGSFHIVDFGPARNLPAPLRVGLHAWLQNFDVTPRLTLNAEIDRLASRDGLIPFYTELHRGYAQYAVLSRR
jgi:S-adenosylmethionine-diacylgycerolhomoserine-N-methlytransferase